MKLNLKAYFGALLAVVAASFASCSDDFDRPPMVVPQATHSANISILDLKTKYWQDDKNYIDTIREDYYIAGRVVSSDASGNIYKSLVIQDETAALAISINGNSLYNTYRQGQEVVISLKDMYIGKYNSLQQLGYPEYYTAGNAWEATFLPLELFESHVELNGLPNPAKVDTTTVKLSELPATPEGLCKWQSRLVRLDNVTFSEANGSTTFSDSDASTSRTLVDSEGNSIIVRNSNYASFASDILPLGEGSVVGILSYYSAAWQLLLIDANGCIGFSTDITGTEASPYTVERAIELQGSGKSGWVSGYVVGAVAPEVTTVKSNSDIEWKAPTTLATTLVIAPAADTKDYTKCLVVALPQGSKFREQANLKDNAFVYGSAIKVKGTLANYMGTNGITGNSGSTSEYVLTVTDPNGGAAGLDEGFEGGAIPSDWLNLKVKGDKDWFTKTYDGNTYASVTGYKGTAPFDAWLISPAVNMDKVSSKVLSFETQVNGYGSTTSKFEVYVLSSSDPTTATLTKLNPTLATAPDSGYSDWVKSGNIDLSKFTGVIYIGFRFTATEDANYATWCLDNVKLGEAGGGDTPSGGDQGGATVSGTRGDFETFNGGQPKSTYGTFTTTSGWTATNCNILSGGASDANPVFSFIGYVTGSTTQYAFAPCMNGKTTAVGTIVSPKISGGCGKLKFSYGCAYTESKGASFRVDIKQNGSVVKSFTVTKSDAVKLTAYTEELDVNVTGDFSIEFVNLSPSANDSSNKDRVAIWNVEWTNN